MGFIALMTLLTVANILCVPPAALFPVAGPVRLVFVPQREKLVVPHSLVEAFAKINEETTEN